MDIKAYSNLLKRMCEIEKLNEIESGIAISKLSSKINEISNLREYIEQEYKEYTEISYFFVVFLITISSKENSNYIEDFKNESILIKIKDLIKDQYIKRDIYHFKSEKEYIAKYQKDYYLLRNGLEIKSNKQPKSTLEIIIEEFWKIFEEL